MSTIHDVKLELLRSGPAHNQLLSPLTPYIALCGMAGPVTVSAPFEHRQLLARLERLRYGSPAEPILASQREAELRDLGESVGRFLGQVPTLVGELSCATKEQPRLVNLRLAISAYELGLVPFEAMIGPEGFPSSGAPLVLRSLVSITREIRRTQPLALEWNRPPRILFAFAAPNGSYVPWQDHVVALGRALKPWTKLSDDSSVSAQDLRRRLTILPDASVESIREACRTGEYTHVHILAHGAPFKEAGIERYGLMLCTDSRNKSGLVVDGESLAIALTGCDASGSLCKPPTLVSLAVCDSGNANQVLVPGGSIAHELHMQGIPWVVASQFPLWMQSSTLAVELLYAGLLEGNDPRWVLYELRQRLRTDMPGKHDWASIVAYATIAPDLEAQVAAFRDRQFRSRTEVLFDRMDTIAAAGQSGLPSQSLEELDRHSQAIRGLMESWRAEPVCQHDAKQRAERLGLSAASEKRIAIAYALADKHAASHDAYRRARDFYRKALHADPVSHWLLTQYLSLTAVLASMKPDDLPLARLCKEQLPELRSWWNAALQIARWQCECTGAIERAWALATQAELELLGIVYGAADPSGGDRHATIDKTLQALSQQLRALLEPEAFPMQSTLRQFRRYTSQWSNPRWEDLAQTVITTLEKPH